MRDLRIEVEEVGGFCDLPMRPGDYFELRGGRITLPPGGHMCMWALAAILPMLPAKQRARHDSNDWLPGVERMMCPDPAGRVIYRIIPLEGPVAASRPPRMLVDAGACSGCRSCELACSWRREAVYDPTRALVQVDKDERAGLDQPNLCRQCGVAPCVEACPRGALSRDADTLAVMVDTGLCDGCGTCTDACAFSAIRLRDGRAWVCDLCGGDPACVAVCVTGALRYGDRGGKRF